MNKKLIPRVLVVDNDPIFYKLLSEKLSREGILFKCVKNAKMAIYEVGINIPDLIITDILLPGLNGFELIKELKDEFNTTNLEYLVVSNYGENRIVYDIDFLNTLGIRKYLIKSNYTTNELIKEIKKSINECKKNPLKQ